MLLIGFVWIASLGPVQLPWVPSPVIHPKISPSPTLTTRTDSAAADFYLNGIVGPSFSNLGKSENKVVEVCVGLLTLSCQDALTDSDNHVKDVMSVMDRTTAPPCIAVPAAKMRTDLTNIDKGLQLALQGYTDNRASELSQGLAQFRFANRALTADYTAAVNLQKNVCSSQLTGP